MPVQREQLPSADRVPYGCLINKAPCGQAFSIWTERYTKDVARITLQRFEFRPGCGVPDFHGFVRTRRRYSFAIWTEGYPSNKIGVPTQSFQLLPSDRVPYLRGFVIASGR